MNPLYSFRVVVVALLVTGLAAGCAAPTQKVSDTDRKAFSTVRINGDVKKPASIYYLGPGGATGLAFGIVGALATESTRERQLKTFQEQVEKNGVFIEKIVLEEIDTAVRQSGKLSVSDKPDAASATLQISILQYGFSVQNAFGSKMVPILSVRCEVVDPTGRTIWSAGDRVLTLGNPAEAVTAEELQNPKTMETSWRTAARAIAANIVKEF
jgi:hypothetical protein